MANDREVLREIWEGRLPVCFQLDSEEVYDLQAPNPSYLMVPRLSYFPLVTDKIRKHFVRHIHPDKQEAEMWLDYNGQALKWHYPIGVLFDTYVQSNAQLPWNITVHFDKFPETELLHCHNREAVESHYMACVKEADVLKHRSQVVSTMQKKDHNQLWLGLQNDKFDQFWAVNRKLMEASQDEAFKYIPFRCYRGDDTFVQRLVRPVSEEGQRKTLQDLVAEIFPNETVRVITHGIEPPCETPLQWMSEHLSYPDNFLHLCIQT
ncbi:autophagy protein 5 isoform X1 [Bacillus rossius redtenbacheri]|uniref:autophagy protein 5 isoform X1 n=1 Tax=Bacillus rossius redtenbacheri TaxID=93214 RepID=UPI002FDCD8C7